MEENGIIERVTEPTDWCAPMVPVMRREKGKVRICVDLRRLNESVMREKRTLSILDDLINRLDSLLETGRVKRIFADPFRHRKLKIDHLHNPFRSILFPATAIRYYRRARNLPRQDGTVTRRSTRSGSHHG